MLQIIENIIQNQTFTNYFQPIYQLDQKKTIGYESLLRSEVTYSPETLFRFAHMTNQVFELDIASINNSLKLFNNFCALPNKGPLNVFLNVFSSTLTNDQFMKFLDKLEENFSHLRQNIVFEINETENTEDIQRLKKVTNQLKRNGYKIALDDLGSGYNSLKMFFELEPDYVKIDKYFGRGLYKDKKKQQLLKLLTRFAEDDVDVILEGIEYKEDFQAAKYAGVGFGQGYLLGRPEPLGKIEASISNQKGE